MPPRPMPSMLRSLVLCCRLLFIAAITGVAAEDLLGIHGFVGTALSSSKDSNVKLTQVNVGLYTPAGVRVMETDCAPNGYFFLPLSRPGKYLVKPRGFQGWSFTPSQKLVECGTSECNGGQDVVFEVDGFSINGKITATEGHGCMQHENAELDSVHVKLYIEGGEELAEVACAKDGAFSFDGVMPGEYRIRPHHAEWDLIGPADGIPVHLEWESIVLDTTYTVRGFKVRGSVMWQTHPMEDIKIQLRSVAGDQDQVGVELRTTTDREGQFSFDPVPCGRFTVVAQSDLSDSRVYSFTPGEMVVDVPMGNLDISTPIEVSRFSVMGLVVHRQTREGIKGVTVKVNGAIKTVTNTEGSYLLHDIGEDPIVLEFSREGMTFPEMPAFTLSPLEYRVPVMHPSGYSVCGAVIGEHGDASPSFKLRLTRPSGDAEMMHTDAKGHFCFLLEPGMYTIEVKSSVLFSPRSKKIQVVDAPLDNIKFVQKKVNVGVSVTKLASSKWGALSIVLKSTDEEGSKKLSLGDMSMDVEGHHYTGTFSNVSPQEYQLEIVRDGWCWKERMMKIVVGEEDTQAPTFQQVGIEKRLMLTHDAELSFDGPGTDFIKDGFYQGGVVHHLCFSSNALHKVRAEGQGCFVFNEDIVIDPSDPATLAISASGFKARGSIQLPADLSSEEKIVIVIKSKTTGSAQEVPAEWAVSSGEMVFEFTGVLGDAYEVSPLHETLLFNPQKLAFSHSGTECASALLPFQAKHGTFVTGRIVPSVEDAQVQLILKGVVIDQTISSPTGTFSFGPYFDIDRDIAVAVEKQGYEFIALSIEKNTFSVASTKLVKVEVAISMQKSDKSGVLVALAGSKHAHRSNAQTNIDGIVSFWKLPADSYYIKPMLREYEFEPPFVQMDVDGTRDERIKFRAKRTGFSVFGNITSLNQQALSDVSVLARSAENEEFCVSDEHGQYRLQNLKPSVEYTISILTVAPVRAAWPTEKRISIQYDPTLKSYVDLQDIDFVAFKWHSLKAVSCSVPVLYRDDGTVSVTGTVAAADEHLTSTEVQILRTVRSDGGMRLVTTLKPYFNGWFEAELPYPGKYTLKVINKELEAVCQLPSRTITLDTHTAREVYVGDMQVECRDATEQENVDYKKATYWPVLVTLLAILAVPFRNMFWASPAVGSGR